MHGERAILAGPVLSCIEASGNSLAIGAACLRLLPPQAALLAAPVLRAPVDLSRDLSASPTTAGAQPKN